MKVTVALIQMNSSDRLDDNIHKAREAVMEAASMGADLVALPENWAFMGPYADRRSIASTLLDKPMCKMYKLAKELSIHLLLGSVAELSPLEEDNRVYNTSVLVGPDGQIKAVYRKMHLFDAVVETGPHALESSAVIAGDEVVVAETPFGKLGMAICYDLRFPELFRKMATVIAPDLIALPAAFTWSTGKDHWELLLRARAIENSCYVIAPNQVGYLGTSRCWGHSMIINPWGQIVAELDGESEGICIAQIDLDLVGEVRTKLPSLKHRRIVF